MSRECRGIHDAKMIPRYQACQRWDFLASLALPASILPDTFAPLSSFSRLPSGFSRHDETFPDPHQPDINAGRAFIRTYTAHLAWIRDFDIMNVYGTNETRLRAVLDAANILIRDTCRRYSKTYPADGDYHYRNRIKRPCLDSERQKVRSERHNVL